MKNKVRPILIKKREVNTGQPKAGKDVLDHNEVFLAAKRAKKAVMEKSTRSDHILIVEED